MFSLVTNCYHLFAATSVKTDSGWDCLKMAYTADWPLHILFTPPVLDRFVFRLLCQITPRDELGIIASAGRDTVSREADLEGIFACPRTAQLSSPPKRSLRNTDIHAHRSWEVLPGWHARENRLNFHACNCMHKYNTIKRQATVYYRRS